MVLENNYLIQKFDPEVLREYDIRGVVNDNINENTAYTIGRTFGFVVQSKTNSNKVVTGYDGRLTSPLLHKALCVGLKDAGIEVIDVDMGPTPMIYFADYHYDSDAAIMVTGSHNPAEYNGFKMVLKKHSFYSEDIQNLQFLTEKNKLKELKGSIKKYKIIDHYVDRILRNIKINKPIKVAWDIGNGAMGVVINNVISKLKNTTNFIINEEVDGNFPNHHPDPTVPKNMEQLIKVVKQNNCDIGLAFDGDGDRLGVIDNLGNIIWADQYMLILCSEISKLYKEPKIIMDVKCSRVFFDEAKKMKCIPIMSKTGHSPIKEKMKDLKSPLSGEMSGHVCYGDDFYGYDDAMYVALRLLRILSSEKDSLSSLINQFPKTVSTPETRFDVEEKRKFHIIDEIKDRLKDSEGEVIDIDGIRVQNKLGWFLIRASNTQNQLTCRAEAQNNENLKILTSLIETQLSLSGVNYKFNHG
tara:strand:- start:62 stop:1471 length:1410 start_codon:yes stop_codon:yes gene_type:complete